jgi:cyclopropane-fatty-acyl-phospholipid synthase
MRQRQTPPTRDPRIHRRRAHPTPNAPARAAAYRPGTTVATLVDQRLAGLPVALRLWDGTMAYAPHDAVATVVVRDPRAIAHVLHEPTELGLARAWVTGALDLDGDLEQLLGLRGHLRDVHLGAVGRACLAAWGLRHAGPRALRRPPIPSTEARPSGARHSLARDRAAIHHHYDVSNRFYELLLGPSMSYSCAYFESPANSLEVAQERKFELICRKLRLQPGERLLDVGCGWGSLVVHAAARHGARAVGVTLSAEQAELARERVGTAGVADRVEIRLGDYREITDGPYDKIASIGMYEHVGIGQLEAYAGRIRSLLRPGGLFLNDGVARLNSQTPERATFIRRYVFPDGELPHLSALIGALEQADFEVHDVESLREDYEQTCRRWYANLTTHADEARAEIGPERLRTWQLYLLGSAVAFADGDITNHHVLAGRPAEAKTELAVRTTGRPRRLDDGRPHRERSSSPARGR